MCVILGVVWADAKQRVHGEENFKMKRERVVVDAWMQNGSSIGGLRACGMRKESGEGYI